MTELAFVGVDGGGTHARAIVIDADGRELARRTGPSGLVDPRDPGTAGEVVSQLVREVLADAGVTSAAVLCCGLAGAGRPEQRDAVRIALTLEHIAERVVVVGDAEAAMADAFTGGGGVLIVAGTGSMAWARAAGDAPIRVGGWGMLIGDEGSGYAIGLAALRAVTQAHDGRIPPTDLRVPILAAAQLTEPEGLIAWAAGASKAQIGALAPIVLACADQGDSAAAAIRDEAVRALVLLGSTAARRTALESPEIALTGGLIARGGPLRGVVSEALSVMVPGCTILDRTVDAALGAARIARAAATAQQ